MITPRLIIYALAGLTFIACQKSSTNQTQAEKETITVNTDTALNDSATVYETENLIIQKLSDHVYVHISFLNTDDFGRVTCNGMFVVNENEAVVFDTPSDNGGSVELINYITGKLHATIKALIPTHFHNDCVGGLDAFHEKEIPAYASHKTIALLKNKGDSHADLLKGFDTPFTLTIGSKKLYAEYFGEGHTKDNITGYFPEDNALFGGCLIKEVDAGKGYLGDASINEWSTTVRKIKQKYPQAKIVIPGHGKWGGTELFDYTIKLFE